MSHRALHVSLISSHNWISFGKLFQARGRHKCTLAKRIVLEFGSLQVVGPVHWMTCTGSKTMLEPPYNMVYYKMILYIRWQVQVKDIDSVGVTKLISSIPLFSEFFSIVKTNISYWISHIFDSCHCSSAAVAPVKYKCDSNNLKKCLYVRSKILLTERTEISTPHPRS